VSQKKVASLKLFALFSIRLSIFFNEILPICCHCISTQAYQFNKMALIFLEYLSFLPFQVSSFSKSDCLDFIANDEWPQFTQPQSTGLSGLGAMLDRGVARGVRPHQAALARGRQIGKNCKKNSREISDCKFHMFASAIKTKS